MNTAALLYASFFLLFSAGIVHADTVGEKLFNQKCIMCHIVKGKGGAIGPDLTTVGSRMSLQQIRIKVMVPKRTDPSSKMPSFRTLPATELDAVINHTKNLK